MRLVIQSLRDVGYMWAPPPSSTRKKTAITDRFTRSSAATLEAESGYTMESPEVAEFRHYVMGALWEQAEAALIRLGVTDEDNLMVRFTLT